MRLTSIIIPSCHGGPSLERCVESVKAFTRGDYEMIVVDNGSPHPTMEYCRRKQVHYIHYPEKIGFPAACNRGLALAKGDALLLLNDDVAVACGWLDNMLACLDSDSRVGIVGPMANYASGRQRSRVAYSDLPEFQRLAETLNGPDPGKWEDTRRIVGFCFLFKRELFQRIGFLDERFSPGHFEDDDYCHRARLQGFTLKIAGDVHVHHDGSRTFRTVNQSKAVSVNYRKFMKKWGFDPHIHIEQRGGDDL